VGRFEAADGGTLFLDELGTLPLAAQAKLLRVLQTGEFERLGSSTTRKANVRLVSATNLDLPKAIAAGQFREDLFFRLNVIELHLPPLADRSDDVLPLAEDALARFAKKEGRAGLRFDDDARAALVNHEWPGNVRELHNRVQRAVLVQPGEVIGAGDLGLSFNGAAPALESPARGGASFSPTTSLTGTNVEAPARSAAPAMPPVLDAEAAAERAAVQDALLRAGGVVSKAAAEMGLSRQALYRRMERLGITMERRPR
jgi:DNA-binding NtrC family response regulator